MLERNIHPPSLLLHKIAQSNMLPNPIAKKLSERNPVTNSLSSSDNYTTSICSNTFSSTPLTTTGTLSSSSASVSASILSRKAHQQQISNTSSSINIQRPLKSRLNNMVDQLAADRMNSSSSNDPQDPTLPKYAIRYTDTPTGEECDGDILNPRCQDSSTFIQSMNRYDHQYYGNRKQHSHRQYTRRRTRPQDWYMYGNEDRDVVDSLRRQDHSPLLLPSAKITRNLQCQDDYSDQSSMRWSRENVNIHTRSTRSKACVNPLGYINGESHIRRRQVRLCTTRLSTDSTGVEYCNDQNLASSANDLGTNVLISNGLERHCKLPTSWNHLEDEDSNVDTLSSNGVLRRRTQLTSRDDLFYNNHVSGCFPITKLLLPSRSSTKSLPKWMIRNSEVTSCSDSDLETAALISEAEPSINDGSTAWLDNYSYSTHLRPLHKELIADNPKYESGRKLTKPYRRFDTTNENTKSVNYSHTLTSSTSMSELDVPACNLRNRHRSIHQKHRPRAFKDLIGHNLVVQSLSNCAIRGKVAPVYLFQGPRGTGKTSAARIFAAALCCVSTNPELRPCGCCGHCSSVYSSGTNVYLHDVREMNAHGNSGSESIELFLQQIHVPPSSCRYRIFIIDDCHLLTLDAWNVLLNHLDDPPSYAVFILITSNLEKLSHKVQSHCQKFLFSKIKVVDILSRLQSIAVQEDIHIDIEALQLIASRSDGSLRDAEMVLDQVSFLDKHIDVHLVQELVGHIPEEKLIDLLDQILSPDAKGTVNCVRGLLKSGIDPLTLTSQLAVLITDILSGKNRNAECRFKHVKKLESVVFQQALRILSDTEKQLRCCDDRSTWLIAALLQFSQIDFVSSTTSKSLSNHEPTDSSEESILGMHVPAQKYNHDRASGVVGSHQVLDAQKMRSYKQKPSTSGDSFSVMDEESCEHNSMQYSIAGNPVNQIQLGGIGSCSMDNIWKKVLSAIRSNVVKQLLRSEARFLSLSVTEDVATARLEFRHPEHKALAEKVKGSIENAFEEVLCCPIAVKITLSSPLRTRCEKPQPKKPNPCKLIKPYHGTNRKLPLYYSSPPSAPEYNYGQFPIGQLHEEYQQNEKNVLPDVKSIAQLDNCNYKLLQMAQIDCEAENVIHNHKCSSDSIHTLNEGSTRNASSLFCWKGIAKEDTPYKKVVKHQKIRMKKRGRVLLRFVPCAKADHDHEHNYNS